MAGQPAAIASRKRRIGKIVLMALTMPMLACLIGCQPPDDGIAPAEKQMADRFNGIVKSSGGDFDKLSTADREYVVKEVAHGDANTARMILAAKSGRLRGNPGGRPPK